MGSFEGHLLPGVLFVFYGLSWTLLAFWIHLTTPTGNRKNRNNHTAASNSSYLDYKRGALFGRLSYIPQPFCVKVPIEPLLKILFSSLGIVIEGFTDQKDGKTVLQVLQLYNSDGSLESVSKVHHITMYGAFLVSGLVDLIGLIVRIPRNTSKVFFSLAFFVEALLFWFHVHDKDHLNVAVHTLLIIAIFASLFLSLLRIPQPANVLINSFLGVSILIQGTWFANAGSILYHKSSTWDSSHEDGSNKQIMLAVVIFNWHILGDAFFALVLYVLMLACVRGSVKYRKTRRNGTNKLAWSSLPLQRDSGSNEEEKKLMDAGNVAKDTLL